MSGPSWMFAQQVYMFWPGGNDYQTDANLTLTETG